MACFCVVWGGVARDQRGGIGNFVGLFGAGFVFTAFGLTVGFDGVDVATRCAE